MDITQVKDLIGWVLGVFVVGVISTITGVYNIIKAGRMLPKEMKNADLDNKEKEISIAGKMDEIATKAVDKTIKTQDRLDRLEGLYESLKDKVVEQEGIIEEQAKVIQEQKERLDKQEEVIEDLRCELTITKAHNSALIQQLLDEKLEPVRVESLDIPELKKQKKSSKKNVKTSTDVE